MSTEIPKFYPKEHEQASFKKEWGFCVPTCVIDSQSAPALIGVPAEQAYMRAFLLAGEKDLVVTDFSLNHYYLEDYLKGTLRFKLPHFLVTESRKYPTVTENILADQNLQEKIKAWASINKNSQIQFFCVTPTEQKLSKALTLPVSYGNFEAAVFVNSKPGFRKMCEEIGVPMPEGYICSKFDETVNVVKKFFNQDKIILIKSENGIGGNDLQSNITLSKKEKEASGLDLETYVGQKLEFFGDLLGSQWVVEEKIKGKDGSVHVLILNQNSSTEPVIFGQETELDSYVGAFWPFNPESQVESKLSQYVSQCLVPKLQQMGAFGFHCFDFKGDKFLEDNARLGAIDFIDHLVKRIAAIHFPGESYCWFHCHVPIQKPTSFEFIFSLLGNMLDPQKTPEGCFVAVSNQEVLPFSRAVDLTGISFGPESSQIKARAIFEQAKTMIQNNF